MLMIPTLHVLGHGGVLTVLDQTRPFSVSYGLANLLEAMAFCGVNCYALISGYVGYGRKTRYANLMTMTLQVLFYTVPITAAYLLLRPEVVGVKDVIMALFPFAFRTYWYFMAYFAMFFFMPYLNFALEKLERPALQGLLFSMLLIYCLLPTLFHTDIGGTETGYNALWLMLLYLVGGFLRKYRLEQALKPWQALAGYGCCVLVTWLAQWVVEPLVFRYLGVVKGATYLRRYTSPTIVLCAVFLLLAFARLRVGSTLQKWIAFFAPVTFGVYLLHEEPLIRETLIKDRFVWYADQPPLVMLGLVLVTVLAIWLLGSLVDFVRLTLFRWLKVKQRCERLEERCRAWLVARHIPVKLP